MPPNYMPEDDNTQIMGAMRHVERVQSSISIFIANHRNAIRIAIITALIIGAHVYLGECDAYAQFFLALK